MNILEVHNSWDEDEPGGVVSMMQDLMSELEQRHQVELLIQDWAYPSPQALQDMADRTYYRFRMPGLPFSIWHFKAWLSWPFRIGLAVSRIIMFCRKHRIDVIHLHYPETGYIVFWITVKLGGPPYIVTYHGGDAIHFAKLPRIHRNVQCRLFKGAAATTCVAGWLRDRLRVNCRHGHFPKIIPNGMPTIPRINNERATLEAELGFILPQDFVVLVGNCRTVKGQDIALDAWSRMKVQEGHAPTLLIIGGGPELAAMKRRCEYLGLNNLVFFIGYIPRPHAIALTSLARIQIAPSRSEGHPIVALEAGYVSTPILASSIPAFLELIEDGVTGYLFETESADALAQAVTRIWTNPKESALIGQHLHEFVMTNFSLDAMASSYERLFEQVVS